MWFAGPVMEAVGKAKAENRVLVVFIRHAASDADSDALESYFGEAADLIAAAALIALQLAAGSEAAEQFKAIYPVPRLPMTYFIDPKGKPLDIITGPCPSADTLKAKIHNALRVQESRFGSEVAAASGSELARSSELVPEPSEPLNERVERARALLAQREAEKSAEMSEKERESERRRREEGRLAQEALLRRKEEEAKKDAAERRRAKAADRAHLERLREQIALDRQEKAARHGKESAEKAALAEKKKTAEEEAAAAKRAAEEAARQNTTRIQFRYPDQSSQVVSFEADAALSEAFAHVAAALSERDWFNEGPIRLVQVYPRRELSETTEGPQSFRQLGLSPSAVILVLPTLSRGKQAGGDGGGGESMLWRALSVPGAVLTVLLGLVNSVLAAVGLVRPAVAQGPPQSEGQRQKRIGRLHPEQTSDARRRNRKPDDDDNATWNGNSTQQL